MRGSIVNQLILKDWRLQRTAILCSVATAVAALGLVPIKKEVPVVIGAVWFFIALILLASFLPAGTILNERKKQNLAFLMSLPVSPMQYTAAKMVSTFGMFLIPWLALLGAASLVITVIGLPHGFIPILLVLAGFILVAFALTTGITIVGESEGWFTLATIVCNSSYGLGWYLLARIPAIQHDMGSPTVVWSPLLLKLLGAEFTVVLLALASTFFFQSRKRDFV
jgi:ABC-2 type transport system permease protein